MDHEQIHDLREPLFVFFCRKDEREERMATSETREDEEDVEVVY